MKYPTTLLTLLLVGCSTASSEQTQALEPTRLTFRGQDEVFASSELPTLEAIRFDEPPVLDGKLDDACWEAANSVTGFKKNGGNTPTRRQSVAYIGYDDENLYLGIGCIEPSLDEIRRRPADKPARPGVDDGSVFSYDSVEIMLKSDNGRPRYVQLAVDVDGGTWDAFRSNGGGSIDDEWDGVWTAATAVGEDNWSVELRIPFYGLQIPSNVRSDWRFNICRAKQRPHDLSSIARDGAFNEVHKFAILTGFNVDFSPFFIDVSRPELVGEVGEGAPSASALLAMANNTGKDRRLIVSSLAGSGGEPLRSEEISLAAGQEIKVVLGKVTLAKQPNEGTTIYEVEATPAVKQFVVTDADSGEKLALSNLNYPTQLKIFDLDLANSNEEEAKTAEHPLTIEMTTSVSESALKNGTIVLKAVSEKGGTVLATQSVPAPDRVTRATLDRAGWPIGLTRIEAAFQGPDGQTIAATDRSFHNVPPRESTGKVLNNFVTELLNLEKTDLGSQSTFTFTNPRNGWVYFATVTRGGDVTLQVDQSDLSDPSDQRDQPGGSTITEIMQFFPAGEHTLEIGNAGDASLEHLIVRAIPELAFWRFPVQAAYCDTVAQETFKTVNCIGCTRAVGEDPKYQQYVETWKKQGKRLIVGGALVPAYHFGADMTAEDAYTFWRGYNGYEKPRFDAIIADEFGVGDFPVTHYSQMATALRRLTAEFPKKLFYPFTMDIYGVKQVKPFMQAVIDNGAPIVWEWYEREEPDEVAAKRKLNDTITVGMKGWKDYLFEAHNHIEVCLGYYMLSGESLNNNPGVDFKVWIDMQFHQLATHPAFDGVFGVMEYNSKSVDEETLRWHGLLYRHYGIEGKRNLLSDEYGFNYSLPHLRNPDFDDGLDEWTLTAAKDGSVNTGSSSGYGRLQGRVRGATRGNNFLRMKRSEKAPNRFSQEVRDLEPGRLYCLKMITMDYGDLVNGRSDKQTHAVDIELDNVEWIENGIPLRVYESSRGQETPPFSRDNQPWLNVHWRVFRAKDTSSMLTVSDWSSPDEPGGPIGQELAYNFLELQPFLGKNP